MSLNAIPLVCFALKHHFDRFKSNMAVNTEKALISVHFRE